MSFLPVTIGRLPSPSQPSSVGASAYASTGPTRSGCGLRGAHPLSPSPEVQRFMIAAVECGVRQRLPAEHHSITHSRIRFVSFHAVSRTVRGLLPPRQYYGGKVTYICYRPITGRLKADHQRGQIACVVKHVLVQSRVNLL